MENGAERVMLPPWAVSRDSSMNGTVPARPTKVSSSSVKQL
jgi:hypothetical protein